MFYYYSSPSIRQQQQHSRTCKCFYCEITACAVPCRGGSRIVRKCKFFSAPVENCFLIYNVSTFRPNCTRLTRVTTGCSWRRDNETSYYSRCSACPSAILNHVWYKHVCYCLAMRVCVLTTLIHQQKNQVRVALERTCFKRGFLNFFTL